MKVLDKLFNSKNEYLSVLNCASSHCGLRAGIEPMTCEGRKVCLLCYNQLMQHIWTTAFMQGRQQGLRPRYSPDVTAVTPVSSSALPHLYSAVGMSSDPSTFLLSSVFFFVNLEFF